MKAMRYIKGLVAAGAVILGMMTTACAFLL